MTFRDSGRLSNSQDPRIGQPFQADVRLESLTYVTDVTTMKAGEATFLGALPEHLTGQSQAC